ncbi:hypothetical protein KGM_201800 [Danaus plexippus plexippus]|uniref:Bicaudal D-related protein homolog n=1 Tax=Danaus plexippus plexippus TaxID=278856 RepID=A0A212FJ01_DANPL|nr:hypothetical protein KGM_201800 [Danaus plexippus plexippus]
MVCEIKTPLKHAGPEPRKARRRCFTVRCPKPIPTTVSVTCLNNYYSVNNLLFIYLSLEIIYLEWFPHAEDAVRDISWPDRDVITFEYWIHKAQFTVRLLETEWGRCHEKSLVHTDGYKRIARRCTLLFVYKNQENKPLYINSMVHISTSIQVTSMVLISELEQEKHLLRRRLDTEQGEYEARLVELQNDIKELTAKIDSKDNSVKQREEEKTGLIAELTAQNSRLTNQLKESSAVEAQLLAQLELLKDQCSIRKTSLQDHVQSLESLKAELALMSDKRADLERRLTTSLKDKDSLTQQLDEANDRISALERQLKEQEHLYQNTLKELERLQRSHDTLAERVGSDPVEITNTPRSLHAELESEPEEDENWLRTEAVQVFKQLRALALQLNTGHDDDSGLHSDLSLSSLDGDEGETLRRGALSAACADAVAAYAALEGSRVRDSIASHARRAMERERQIDEKNEIIAELSSKLSVAEVELRASADERDKLLNDATYSSLQHDEAVTKARQERDEAIERKKASEVALAKTRVELMQANSQLYEAVRQKIDLGQQLEQWQMDMQELIDEQMKHKLTSQEKRRKLPPPRAPTRTERLFGLFHR